MSIKTKRHDIIEFRSYSKNTEPYLKVDGKIISTKLKRLDYPGDVVIYSGKNFSIKTDYNFDIPLVEIDYKRKTYFMKQTGADIFISLSDDELIQLIGTADTSSREAYKKYANLHLM